ncbi:MAG: translation initiation factor IF-2 N-terminal domain-containing protein, partial [Anaerococcus vaginalis]
MAKKLRIYELAKEHKKSTKEMLSLLKDEFGLKIKSHMSVLSGDELAIVEEYFGEDKK